MSGKVLYGSFVIYGRTSAINHSKWGRMTKMYQIKAAVYHSFNGDMSQEVKQTTKKILGIEKHSLFQNSQPRDRSNEVYHHRPLQRAQFRGRTAAVNSHNYPKFKPHRTCLLRQQINPFLHTPIYMRETWINRKTSTINQATNPHICKLTSGGSAYGSSGRVAANHFITKHATNLLYFEYNTTNINVSGS